MEAQAKAAWTKISVSARQFSYDGYPESTVESSSLTDASDCGTTEKMVAVSRGQLGGSVPKAKI